MALLEQLSTSRLLVSQAMPSVGVGERRSASKGVGLEFAEHRPYRTGDDVRHIDPRVLARLGESYVRQYFVDRQMPVFVLLDASASMLAGKPSKFDVAAQLAQIMGFVGLAAGDRVRLGIAAGGTFTWGSAIQGASRADRLFAAVDGVEPAGSLDFGDAIERAARDMGKGGYVVLVGDFWDDHIDDALDLLQDRGHEIVAIQVVAPEELDPGALGNGTLVMVDDETGDEIEVAVDEDVMTSYREELAAFQAKLRRHLVSRGGRFFQVSTAANVERFVLHELRTAGVFA